MHISALAISATMFGLASTTSIVRGYNQTFSFGFTIKNHDQTIDVDEVNGENENFLVAVVFSSSNVTGAFEVQHDLSITPAISAEQVQQRIDPKASVELSGQGTVLVPRLLCTQYQYVCVVLHPGQGSSVSIPEDSVDHVSCIQTAGYINCEGTGMPLFALSAFVCFKHNPSRHNFFPNITFLCIDERV